MDLLGQGKDGSCLDLELLAEEALPSTLFEEDSDLGEDDETNQTALISPQPAYSEKFGKLKKSEALEIAFRNLNRQMRSMRAYFSEELDIVASIDAQRVSSDRDESNEYIRYVAHRETLKDQFCDLFKFDFSKQRKPPRPERQGSNAARLRVESALKDS